MLKIILKGIWFYIIFRVIQKVLAYFSKNHSHSHNQNQNHIKRKDSNGHEKSGNSNDIEAEYRVLKK